MDFDRVEGADEAHEEIVHFSDGVTGLAGVIAIHSTALGPAAGGCRMAHYADRDAAVLDARRLSRGMSYKNAVAGLPAGGGKAVIYQVDPSADRGAVFEAFGRSIEALGGRYITAEDVGTRVSDMQRVAKTTRFVAGLPSRGSTAGGDPSPWTAMGVFLALEAAVGRPLDGCRVAVQGLGNVGYALAEQLAAAGVELFVSDHDPGRVQLAVEQLGARPVGSEGLFSTPCDIFAPCGFGGVLNAQTVGQLHCAAVAGAANNQLAHADIADLLEARGILYAPDYVINSGGLIYVALRHRDEPLPAITAHLARIGRRLTEVYGRAQAEKRSPARVADALAERILYG